MYFAYLRGCSSVWLEYLPVTQGVAGSSPVNPEGKDVFRTSENVLFLLIPKHLSNPGISIIILSHRDFYLDYCNP